MTHSGFGKLLVATAMTFAMVTAASAYTSEQEAMCTGDAFRLCSSEIPDIPRVTACMLAKKSQLSAGCRAVMESSAPAPASYQPAAGASAKPLNITPKPKRNGA